MNSMRSVTVKPALSPGAGAENGRYRSLPFGRVETSASRSQVFTTGITVREGDSQRYGESTTIVGPTEDPLQIDIAAPVSGGDLASSFDAF